MVNLKDLTTLRSLVALEAAKKSKEANNPPASVSSTASKNKLLFKVGVSFDAKQSAVKPKDRQSGVPLLMKVKPVYLVLEAFSKCINVTISDPDTVIWIVDVSSRPKSFQHSYTQEFLVELINLWVKLVGSYRNAKYGVNPSLNVCLFLLTLIGKKDTADTTAFAEALDALTLFNSVQCDRLNQTIQERSNPETRESTEDRSTKVDKWLAKERRVLKPLHSLLISNQQTWFEGELIKTLKEVVKAFNKLEAKAPSAKAPKKDTSKGD